MMSTDKQEGITIEQLLKPRYKVIADWPGTCHKSGEIVNPHPKYGFDLFPYPAKYPHLFKRLEWWEEREEKDMPKYLKWPDNGTFIKVKEYDIPNGLFYDPDGSGFLYRLTHTVPATNQEYFTYQTK